MVISIARYDRKDYITVKEKYVRYVLKRNVPFPQVLKAKQKPAVIDWDEMGIAQVKREWHGGSHYIYATDFGSYIRIYKFKASKQKDKFKPTEEVIISFKKGRLNIWWKHNLRSIRNISASPNMVTTFVAMRRTKNRELVLKRLNNIFVNFLKRNGIIFKRSKKFEVNALKACYPAFRKLDLPENLHLKGAYSRYFRKYDNVNSILKVLFGNSGSKIKKEFYTLLSGGNLTATRWDNLMQFGVLSRKLIPFDTQMRVIESDTYRAVRWLAQTEKSITSLRKLLKNYNQERLKHLFLGAITTHDITDIPILLDAAKRRNVNFILPERPRNFHELHDNLTRQLYPNRANVRYEDVAVQNFDLNLIKVDKLNKIDGTIVDDMKIVVPKTNDELRDWGSAMHNCLHGDTKIITYDGVFCIKDLVNKEVKLLTKNVNQRSSGKWIKAKIKSYGRQPLLELVLERNHITKTVYATLNHRWFVYTSAHKGQKLKEVTTGQLQNGFRIPAVFTNSIFNTHFGKKVKLSPIGIMHGIVFGDGSAPTKASYHNFNRSAEISLFGDKNLELLKWFPQECKRRILDNSIGGIQVCNLPRYFKSLPSLEESASYLLGWMAGYFAADGNIDKDGCSFLYCVNLQFLQFVANLCQRFGIRYTEIKKVNRNGFGGYSDIYKLTFEVGALSKDFYLLSQHKERAKNRKSNYVNWIVKSIKNMPLDERVFCAEVPETHTFVLDGNILTGNCIGGYGYQAKEGQVWLLGVMKGTDIVYNLSIRNGQLEQFFAPCNQEPDMNDRIKIVKALEEAKIVITKDEKDILAFAAHTVGVLDETPY